MKLPLEYREPLVLQVLGGFSTEEIARELTLSPSAVLTRLFRARNKLRVLCGMTAAPPRTIGPLTSAGTSYSVSVMLPVFPAVGSTTRATRSPAPT